jgi:hypothetical protein
MTINNNCGSHFDLLTAEEVEEWARLRSVQRDKSSGKGLWEAYSAEIDFVLRMQTKYKVRYHFHVDEYIKSRRRSDKLSVILGSDSNEQ